METLLRGEKSAGGIPFSLDAPVLYYPVRHHSPACAWHLERVMEWYRPECVLVEGPENANDLIPVLVHPDTKAPMALYYAYWDRTGLLDREKGEEELLADGCLAREAHMALRIEEASRQYGRMWDRLHQDRLKQESAAVQRVILSIFSDPRHRNTSRFLHQTVFLNCGFARLEKGPDCWSRAFSWGSAPCRTPLRTVWKVFC